VRLLGVGVTQLAPAARRQLSLFDGGAARSARLNRALDQLADRFGSRAVVRGAAATPSRAALSLQRKPGSAPEDEDD
jgi:hypothetical protein